MAAGIYAIQRKDSDERYIGSAVCVTRRWAEHKRDLLNGKHCSQYMQHVYDKHGAAALEFAILEPVADKAGLIEREQVWLDRFSPAYNTATIAGSSLGLKHTPEALARMSAAHMGKKHPPEFGAAISARQTGKRLAPAHIAAVAAAHRGMRRSAEARARMSGRPTTPEQRAAIVARMTGRKHSPETRAKMSLAQKARPPCSPETRAKISAAAKAQHATARLRSVGAQ